MTTMKTIKLYANFIQDPIEKPPNPVFQILNDHLKTNIEKPKHRV